MVDTTGNQNVAVGATALDANTTGDSCVAIGFDALGKNTTANQNTAVGKQALKENTTGDVNTAVGFTALYSTTTGSQNTAIGENAGANITTGNNNICIGRDSSNLNATESNVITLGNSSNDNLRCNDTSISSLSDRRDKTEIIDLPAGLDFINNLLPRKFKWETRDGNIKDGLYRAGFIAQELQEAQKDSDYLDLVLDKNPERLEAKQEHLIPVLVKAIQELSAKVTALEAG